MTSGISTSSITRYEPFAALAAAYADAGFAAESEQMAPLLLGLVFEYDWVGGAALDLGCGTGELACYLAEHGLRTFAVDTSREMLSIAQQAAQPKGLTVEWAYSDLRTFRPNIPVDLVTCMGGTLNLLPTLADLEQTFKAVSTSLAVGKFFVFDLFTLRGLAAQPPDQIIVNTDRTLIVTRNNFNFETLMLTRTYHILTYNGMEWRRAEEKHLVRGYPAQALGKVLSKYGLRLLRTLDMNMQPADPTSADRIILLAQRE